MMTSTTTLLASIALFLTAVSSATEEGFTQLFDGKSLDGWKVSENPDSFKVADGVIVAHGPRAHAFYVGEFNGAKFKDFELRMEVMTKTNSNGGVFFHSEWVDKGWPPKGYEVQVNNTHKDWRKSGGLYAVVDNKEPFEDNTWMQYVIRVKDGVVTASVNGKELVNHTPKAEDSKLQKDGGAIALQAHDPGSVVHYKNIRIKPLK
ncbi:3-keto-disaccharide hydrolase [Haloferula sp.]|uniref:3-keto-disaccharide hydrolase n=1 Tax=Haloferula sp. TaxID=2497595 RepID=UPI00329B0589